MNLGKELNSLSEEIADFWFKNSKKNDFRFYELFGRVNRLAFNTSNQIDLEEKDIELANIMSFMETKFYIPILKINLVSWLKEDSKNSFILSIYQKLFELRSI